jgi:hypothetical protein
VARHPGARVHFDVRREDGAERAVDVTLRTGTRVSHHQGRYGTLTGARRPDTKGAAPFARAHPEEGRMLAAHPLEVVRSWVDRLQSRDLDGAVARYRSDAVIHAEDGDHVGPSPLRAYLERSPMFGHPGEPDLRGEDGAVVVRWAQEGDAAGLELRGRVEHGELVEQWAGPWSPETRSMEVDAAEGPITVSVLTKGRVAADEVDYALQRIGVVVRHLEDPVLFGRLKLGRAGDPARAKSALAQVVLDVNGELLRAQVAAHTMQEAADLLQRHLSDKLEQRASHREALRTRGTESQSGEWRHGDAPRARPDYFERPAGERELVRHKSYAVDELTPDEAASDMAQLDYDFHLFRDLASGEDSVLERRADGSYVLTRLHPSPVEAEPMSIEVSTSSIAPPDLSVPEAIERLDTSGERYVFFAHADTGRGALLYRRYDGHYGLIVAVDDDARV